MSSALKRSGKERRVEVFVSDAMIRAGKAVLLELIDKSWPEFVVDRFIA